MCRADKSPIDERFRAFLISMMFIHTALPFPHLKLSTEAFFFLFFLLDKLDLFVVFSLSTKTQNIAQQLQKPRCALTAAIKKRRQVRSQLLKSAALAIERLFRSQAQNWPYECVNNNIKLNLT